ncbi:MAG TPA: metal ABC transporter permease [Candidatus Saccharimonadales bacterium]|nr:metal ABC transporter permease [Candidatus Saccharimonadales bacterium]
MNIIYLQLLITSLLVAASCALPGTFLILRGTSLMSDALGHAILLGIVLSFFITGNLHSPIIFLGATLTGIIMVAFIELLIYSKRLKTDAVIGIVFPLLFSIAIILINLYASSIHIDIDAALLGELSFTPFHTLTLWGRNLGPYAIWTMSIILAMNIITIAAMYPALKIATFDKNYATLLHYRPHLIHYALMTITAITIVGAFECAGAILVVAFMIIPPATAYLLTHRLSHMLIVSCLFGLIAAVSGCIVAHIFNVSIAGSIATVNGLLFFLILFLQKLRK